MFPHVPNSVGVQLFSLLHIMAACKVIPQQGCKSPSGEGGGENQRPQQREKLS